MVDSKLIGPADAEAGKKEESKLIDDVKTVESGGFSLSDFRALTTETAREVHPFEGYAHPMGKIKMVAKDRGKVIGEQMVHVAYVVAYNHPVPQDPSGRNYVVTEDYKMDEVLKFGPYEGKTIDFVLKKDPEHARNLIKAGKPRPAPLATHHNRALRDWQEMRNYDVVFDRVVILKDGEMPNVAYVPNHNLRAQLIYTMDERTGAIKADSRYAIIDREQTTRLLQTFRGLFGRKLSNIKLQQAVTGEIELAEGDELPG